MFEKTAFKIVCYAGIEDFIVLICQYIDIIHIRIFQGYYLLLVIQYQIHINTLKDDLKAIFGREVEIDIIGFLIAWARV